MDRADFVHLVRLSEHASADDSVRYRRGVAAFAALGYAWVLACLALSVGIIAWVALAAQRGRFSFTRGWLLLFALGLLWATLRALWVRFDEPEGQALSRADAPMLFEALDRIRAKIKGPPVHRVYLDDAFNASIRQVPRFGLFGGAVNSLTVGLPLLMMLDRQRLLSVLAHEYGHLRGQHGKLSAWIYRTRLSWLKLDESLQQDEGVMALVSQAFFRWYFPRFAARTFALARQDEYEADRIAARLLGAPVAAAALTEIAIKDSWYAEEFWAAHWARAEREPEPPGPFQALMAQAGKPLDDAFARHALREAMRQVSDLDDTHPVLRDRLEALGQKAAVPAWSAQPALGMLADGAKWIAHFDRQWRRAHATDWKQHHAHRSRIRARVELLAVKRERTPDEWVEWADAERRLDPSAPVRARYESALQIAPEHPGALRGLAQVLPARERAERLAVLDRLHQAGAANRWWAAKTAVAALEDPDAGTHDEASLKLWRGRLKEAEDAEARAWEELTETPFFSQIARHDLGDHELGELRADLARCLPVSRAWVVRKNLREFPWRRAYVVFVELPKLEDAERWQLCRELEQTLSLPGMGLVLWAGHSPTLADIERQAFGPTWTRGG
ncbi:Zn-dependent protease with chaperone function [Variovorax sp. TBS-050B]|uniref:M48 family metalloprotease n=1 Tax=Variovorax sp. TBS-050B TaxID=2940551 RepID=UPI002473C5EE|nr:M48 family metalloprotease [Variovorax sp. TBS-050B]MDH6593173.1 Zn-dependent protease with chaperone function [Variovorax sp. TBS-050B]